MISQMGFWFERCDASRLEHLPGEQTETLQASLTFDLILSGCGRPAGSLSADTCLCSVFVCMFVCYERCLVLSLRETDVINERTLQARRPQDEMKTDAPLSPSR